MSEEQKPVHAEVTKEDIEKGKTMAIVSYLGFVGFIIALVTDGKTNPYVKFHMNQALPVELAFFLTIVPVLGWFISIAAFIFLIMGIIAAANGEMKRLPIIGNLDLIK